MSRTITPTWPESSAEGPRLYNKLITGRHLCLLEQVEETILEKRKGSWESLNGSKGLKWTFKVIKGPSSGCRVMYETPLEGYIKRSTDGKMIGMSFLSKMVIEAINPQYDGKGFDLDSFHGKNVEIDLVARDPGPDGKVSMWPQRINGVYPYFGAGAAGTPLEPMFSKEDKADMEPKHKFGEDDDIFL